MISGILERTTYDKNGTVRLEHSTLKFLSQNNTLNPKSMTLKIMIGTLMLVLKFFPEWTDWPQMTWRPLPVTNRGAHWLLNPLVVLPTPSISIVTIPNVEAIYSRNPRVHTNIESSDRPYDGLNNQGYQGCMDNVGRVSTVSYWTEVLGRVLNYATFSWNFGQRVKIQPCTINKSPSKISRFLLNKEIMIT